MALGRQFQNTYWNDPDTGESKSWSREKNEDGTLAAKPTVRTNASAGETSDHQGMLFHPSTATGRKDDPLVPLERREIAASIALGLTDVDAYKSRVRNKTNTHIADRRAHSDANLLTNSLVDSAMPTKEMQGVRTSAYVNPRKGGGFAEEHSDTIMIGKQKTYKKEITPEHTIKVTKPSSTPIHNPKFWDWHDKTTEAPELTESDIMYRMHHKNNDVHWSNPETGESLKPEEASQRTEWDGTPIYGPTTPEIKEHPDMRYGRDYDVTEHGPISGIDPDLVKIGGGRIPKEQGLEKLRESGFVPNIFPGAGKSTAKVHTNPSFTVERNYSNDRGVYPSSRVHTRFVPGDVREETVPEKTEYKKISYVNQGTLIHEIGHQQDHVISDRYSHRRRHDGNGRSYAWADPLEEGFADGKRDRQAMSAHGGMGDMYEDVLHDSSDPTGAMKRGYGVDHSQWKNKTHKALYAASRVASRTGNNGRNQYPSREEISESLGMSKGVAPIRIGLPENRDNAESVNTMALGHMLTTTPSLMKHLKAQGLHDTGKQARSAYIDARRNNERRKNGVGEQLGFPGME